MLALQRPPPPIIGSVVAQWGELESAGKALVKNRHYSVVVHLMYGSLYMRETRLLHLSMTTTSPHATYLIFPSSRECGIYVSMNLIPRQAMSMAWTSNDVVRCTMPSSNTHGQRLDTKSSIFPKPHEPRQSTTSLIWQRSRAGFIPRWSSF